MRHKLYFFNGSLSGFLTFLLVTLMASCNNEEDNIDVRSYLEEPICESEFSAKTSRIKVVGFYPSYRHETLPISSIKWDKITRIVYAFVIPNVDGSLNTVNLTRIDDMVNEAHANGVEVYFSVGGGGGSENFPAMATNMEARERFALEVREFIFRHCLDGVDIDWEYWTGSLSNMVIDEESIALVEIVKELKSLLGPFNKGISIDLSASNWGGRHIYDDVYKYVDDLQVMAYDYTGPWSQPGPHSSYEDAIGSNSDKSSLGLAYWANFRQWPADRLLLGVPFYGRDFDVGGGTGISYSEILRRYPDASNQDRVENIYYNGMNTIRKKTEYVIENQHAGVMIWELAQDHPEDSISLLNVIDQVAGP